MDEHYLAESVWEPLERLPLEMPPGTRRAERSRCECALFTRREARTYGQDFGVGPPSKICVGLRKFLEYQERLDGIDKIFSLFHVAMILVVPAAIFWLINVTFPKYDFNANPNFSILLGLVSLLIFGTAGVLRWRNIMTSFSVSRITASVFVGLLIAPGTFIFVSYRGRMIAWWQMAFLVVSLSVAGAILLGVVMNWLRNSVELRRLPRYIDEDVIGVMMLHIAVGLRYVKEIQSSADSAYPLYADYGLKGIGTLNRASAQTVAISMQRLAREVEILFISVSRQTLATQSVALLDSWRRLITSTIRARASLILLPGIDYDSVIHDIVEDAKLALDGNWKALASQHAMIDASTESMTSRLMSRIVLASAILAGAFILPYLPDLIPNDQRADVQKTLAVSAFLALINASKQG
jgi:hypothetical protein